MESVRSVSSEEELLKLRNADKISEAEYHDLLGAMRQAPPKDAPAPTTEVAAPASRRKCGRIAFTLMWVGLLLPAICFFALTVLAPENTGPAIGPWFFLGVAFEMVAFALGVSSWPDAYARGAVVTISVMAASVLLILVLGT